jgi:hypothetical protein
MEDIEILQPFGPSIAKVTIPDEIIKLMNNYIDEVIKDEKKSEFLDGGYKLAGNVAQEFRLEGDFMKKIKWIDFLALSVQRWLLKKTGKKLKKFDLIASWIVRQFKNEYNPVHWHTGHISGAGWLKLPDNFGTTNINKKNNPNGKINFIHGSKQFLSNPRTEISPKVGDMCIFPHYLMHEVYPFNSEGERRSISFNALIDDEIFNTSQLKSA